MSVPALLPVTDDTVENGVQHDQQAHGFEVLAQILNVKAQQPVIGVDIGLMREHIEGAGGEQLQSQGNIVGGRLFLHHQITVQVLQGGRLPLKVLDVFPVDIGRTAVDDGFFFGPDFLIAHQLLT